jgi:DNA modification methylase
MTGSARVIRGNALALPLADSSVDLVVTSPPYFGLRSYQDAGEHYDGQIGAEATPAEFVDALIAATREMVRVLKPSGSIWVNLGDKYNSASSGQNGTGATGIEGGRHDRMAGRGATVGSIRTKSLIGIPWRYALRCIDDLGLILRAEIIWAKPNGLPESVTDRVRRSHEQWFHFTVQPRYYSAVDEIRTPHLSEPGREGKGALGGQKTLRPVGPSSGSYNPAGALPGSVWSIPTQPLQVPDHLGIDHFAAFPMEWPRRIIQGWSPTSVCTRCGEGRKPVQQSQRMLDGEPMAPGAWKRGGVQQETSGVGNWRYSTRRTITGYACACTPSHMDSVPTDDDPDNEVLIYDWDGWDAPATIPAVVLDPFGGTGTTALVAKMLGRTGVSVDMSADYCRLAQWRTNDPGQMAAALQVEKPAPVHVNQLSLFDGVM